MVKAVILLSVMMVSLVYCLPAEPQGYRLKYKVDYDDVLRHPEKLQAFFKCLMDTAPCDPPTAELKSKCAYFIHLSGRIIWPGGGASKC